MRKAKFNRLWLLIVVFLCLFHINSYASIPSPTKNYYLDELNVLDQDTKDNINETNRQLEDKTGSQVIVMTLNNPEGLEGSYYGTEIFNAWKIGDQKNKNGVLILLLKSEDKGKNQINIITGYGIEGRLNDGKVGRIIDNFMMDKLREGDYSQALNEGFNAVVGEIALEYDIELEKDYTPYQDQQSDSYNEGGISLGTIIFIIVVFIIISNIINNNNNYGGGGGFRRRRRYGYPRYGPGWSSWNDSSWGSWGGGSGFGGGSSGGGFSGGGGSSGGGGAGRSF